MTCGAGGVCCERGETCALATNGSGICTAGGPLPAHSGPQGAQCNGGFCPTGDVCATDGCCPQAAPVRCGAALCCPAGTTCTAQGCGCPSGSTVCGDTCCGPGSQCAGGLFVAACRDPALSAPCGGSCCATCADAATSTCACPDDHPVKCGDTCCLPGAACGANGQCGCPGGAVTCGDVCCLAGQICSGGTCAAPSTSGSGATCGSDAACAGFAGRNCHTAAEGRCGTDQLCHCCYDVCGPGTGRCACVPCSQGCVADTSCVEGVCVFDKGGAPSE